MLYWLFNEDFISILVCHDIEKGEFVLQVPFYPAIQDMKEYTQERCLEIIKKCLFSKGLRKSMNNCPEIGIKSINTWCMEGLVAESFV